MALLIPGLIQGSLIYYVDEGVEYAIMVEIKLFETNTFYVGQETYISLKQHLSVGKETVAKSEDDSIISTVRTRFSYFKPMIKGKTGGDAGERTFIFKAHKAGSTVITVQKLFRGSLKEERSINVIVIN